MNDLCRNLMIIPGIHLFLGFFAETPLKSEKRPELSERFLLDIQLMQLA